MIQRMDNVLIVVEDLEAAKAFFVELGMELEGETTVEGPWVDQTVGLNDVRADITMMRTPDGHGRVELRGHHHRTVRAAELKALRPGAPALESAHLPHQPQVIADRAVLDGTTL